MNLEEMTIEQLKAVGFDIDQRIKQAQHVITKSQEDYNNVVLMIDEKSKIPVTPTEELK